MKKQLTQEQLEKRKAINKKVLKFGGLPILILFVLICMVGTLCNDDGNKTKSAAIDHSNAAYVEAKELVKNKLKYPEEANFDWVPKYNKNEGNNNYRIVGFVEAKNGFGVKEKLTFKCVIHLYR